MSVASWHPCCCGPVFGSTHRSSSGSSGVRVGRGSTAAPIDLVTCSCCKGGKAPARVLVSVPRMLPGAAPCPKCGDYEGGYIVDATTAALGSGKYCLSPALTCHWVLEFDSICGRTLAQFSIGCSPDAIELQFALMQPDCHGGGQWLRWWRVLAASPATFDCCFNGLEIPYAATTNDCTTVEPALLFGLNCAA